MSRDRLSTLVEVSPEMVQAVRSAAQPETACVVVLYGAELGKRATLGRGSFVIGRDASCDLQLDQESVSRRHARILWDGTKHTLEDSGSTNGTYLNDQQAHREVLQDGDQIKIGRCILKYMSGSNVEASYHEEIYRLMTTDALTSTFNRRYFQEAIERECARSQRYRRSLSLLIFDVDHFKKINDTYGHVAGDSVLRQLAAIVRPRLRQQDILARVGGEEFAILLPEVELPGGLIVAEKVRKLVESSEFAVDQKAFTVTVSVGVAAFDAQSAAAPAALYEAADQQLYAAKNGGRNRVAG